MKPIPHTADALVLRTDFSDDATWEAICAKIRRPVGIFRFRAHVAFLSDPTYEGAGPADIRALTSPNYAHTFLFIVDRLAVAHPEHPLLVLDLYEDSTNIFRTIPAQIQGIENNLSIANMDFEEFAGAVDADGIFRDFRQS